MRLLVACDSCRRQYDVGEQAAGSLLRCACGAALRVPAARAHDAAVVRCSSCGAPRQTAGEARANCAFCGSDFTLRELELNTLCPGCAARIADRARFCHHCGIPIAPQPLATARTAHLCPACGEGAALRSRRLGDMAALECARCGGLWLGRDAFERLASRHPARSTAELRPAPRMSAVPAAERRRRGLYRPCPRCRRLMHRRNFGRRSGVILDLCAEHGAWFDADELARIVEWLRAGGLEASRRRGGTPRAGPICRGRYSRARSRGSSTCRL
jgi:Zn-finger nucleic acid-binding protein